MTSYSAIYDPETDFDVTYTRATAARIASRLKPGERVLELGCATGEMTASLCGEGRAVVAVDMAGSYLERAQARELPGVCWVEADLEAGVPVAERFDHVVCANVLHELDDPAALLGSIASDALAPGGLVHATLQNPQSLHRLVAMEMGLIGSLTEIAATGSRYATRRLYTHEDLLDLATGAGLVLEAREGIVLKPLANDAMAALDPAVVEGFVLAARHLPAHCAMNYWVLRHDR